MDSLGDTILYIMEIRVNHILSYFLYHSVFLEAFSILRCEKDELPYTALRPTSNRLSHDTKTAKLGAGVEKIREEPLWWPCFPDNDAILAKDCQVA